MFNIFQHGWHHIRSWVNESMALLPKTLKLLVKTTLAPWRIKFKQSHRVSPEGRSIYLFNFSNEDSPNLPMAKILVHDCWEIQVGNHLAYEPDENKKPRPVREGKDQCLVLEHLAKSSFGFVGSAFFNEWKCFICGPSEIIIHLSIPLWTFLRQFKSKMTENPGWLHNLEAFDQELPGGNSYLCAECAKGFANI